MSQAHVRIAPSHSLLHLDGAAHRIDDAGELGQQPVARRLDDPAAMLGNAWIEQFTAMAVEAREGAFVIGADQPTVSGDVSRKDRRKLSLDAVGFHPGFLPGAGMIIRFWPRVGVVAVRAREAAADDLRRKRQQLLSFLLRHGRIYESGGHWTLAHPRWLARQSFEHTAQQIVFQEKIDAIEDAAQRCAAWTSSLRAVVPTWSMAPVVEAYRRCAAPHSWSR